MHIHLPKPLHGWREFLGEIGIIVIGVLIALASEQAIETWHWHEKARSAEASMKAELRLALLYSGELKLFTRCEDEQIQGIEKAIVQRDWSKAYILYAETRGFANRNWSANSFSSAVNGQVVDHINAKDLQTYTEAFEMVRVIRGNQQSFAYNQTFLMLAIPGLPKSDAMFAEEARAVASFKEQRSLMRAQSETFTTFVKDRFGISVSRSEVLYSPEHRKDLADCQAAARQIV